MDGKPNKLFSAPSKKRGSLGNSHEKGNETSKAEEKVKKSKQPTCPTNAGSGKRAQPKKPERNICKSLTEEEYADIFNSVLNKDLYEAQRCGDDLDELATDIPIDQWNDRQEDSKENHESDNFTVKKKRKEKEKTNKPLKKKEKIDTKRATKHEMKSSSKMGIGGSIRGKDDLINPELEHRDEGEETGTWIQCSISNCSKWRYVSDVTDPIDVPDHWDCSLNSDKQRNTCDAPEVEYDESEHILTRFTLGSIVWAKMDGFPWWPAIIDIDPDYDTYFELPTATSMMPMTYHVTFVDEHVSRAWVRSHLIRPYDYKSAPVNKATAKTQSYKRDLQNAISNAEKALELSLQERLDKYSFVKRYLQSKRTITHTKRKKNKRKGGLEKEIISSHENMLKELEIAIETCNNSNDSDFSEDDIEYLPRKPRRQAPITDEITAPDHNSKENGKEHSQEMPESDCDSESENETVTKSKIKQHNGNKFDPDIFTMELDPPEDPHQEAHSENNGSNENDIEGSTATETYQNAPSKVPKDFDEPDENVKILPLKGRNIEDGDAQNLSHSSKGKKKSYSLKKAKKNKEKTPTCKSDIAELPSDFDSEKENKDPKKSNIPERDVVLFSKRKTELHSDKENVIKKKKKTPKNEIQHEMCPKSDGNGTEVNKIEAKESRASFNGFKKIEKREILCRKVLDYGKEDSCNKHDDKKDEKETQGKDAKKNAIVTNKKGKVKSKSFVNPIKDQTTCNSNSCDRKVPSGPSVGDEIKNTKKNKTQLDQFVPDVTNEFIEDELTFISSDIDNKPIGKKMDVRKKKNDSVESEDDELNLSIDSLEDECLDIGNETTEDGNIKCNPTENDKHQFGKFGGHCSEHGSESDPFELIED